MLVLPSRNPVRDQLLEAQIEYHGIDIHRRQLSTRIAQDTNGGQMYKAAYIKSDYSEDNIAQRLKHGETWVGKTVQDTFQWWIFTDEAHFDPSAQKAGWIVEVLNTSVKHVVNLDQ
jgi:hypothetical protein